MPLGFLVIYVVSLMTQGAVEGNAGLRRRDPQAARPHGARRKDLIASAIRSDERGPSGPRFFLRLGALAGMRQRPSLCRRRRDRSVDTTHRFLTYWYYHLPNFVLAALMYTLLGRVLLGLIVAAGLAELHLALLLPHHRSGCRRHRAGDAEGDRAGRDLAVRLRLAVLAARRLPAILFCLSASRPRQVSRTMDRNFYYVGIAFFGMINGIFNQLALLFALIHVQVLAPALLFGIEPLTLMFSSLMVSTATIILGGIPAAIYERFVGAKDNSTEVSLWIWLAGTALLTLPAIGNFFQIGL